MSGIAVILHLHDEPVADGQINQLVQAMAWRGPDHQGIWAEGCAALGAVQLWTTQEEWGVPQPVITPHGDHLVMDGRLDNRVELGHALKISHPTLEKMSDADLLGAAYQQWGKDCVDYLAGSFAFAIWNPTNRTLFAARDPLGMRTFFYFWDGHRFYGASTLQSLRGLSFLKPALDEKYLWDYLTSTFMGSFDPEATPFQEIRRLPAGHTLLLTDKGLDVTRYWKPWSLPPITYKRDAEYSEHFRSLFDQIIASHCRAIGPIGVALSGGMDSSAVVCIAKELEQAGVIPAQDLHTFTISFSQSVRAYAGELVNQPRLDMIAAKYGIPVHKIECDDWLPMFEEIPYRSRVPQDEPFIILPRPYRNMGYKIKQVLPDVRVLMTGLGADEGLSSSLFFIVDWLRQGNYRPALQVADIVARQSAPTTPMTRNQVLFNLILGGMGPRSFAYHLRRKRPGPTDGSLGFRFHFRIPRWLPNHKALTQRAFSRLKLIPKTFKAISAQAAFERNILLLGDNVRLWDDQYIGTAAGLEMRHPFYDRRLVEFVQQLPANQKIGPHGKNKYVLRRAIAGVVPMPPENGFQEGEGFPYIYRESLNTQWPEIEKLFTDSRAAAAGFIDPKLFLEELSKKKTGRGDSTDTEIISTLALEFWLRDLESSHV